MELKSLYFLCYDCETIRDYLLEKFFLKEFQDFLKRFYLWSSLKCQNFDTIHSYLKTCFLYNMPRNDRNGIHVFIILYFLLKVTNTIFFFFLVLLQGIIGIVILILQQEVEKLIGCYAEVGDNNGMLLIQLHQFISCLMYRFIGLTKCNPNKFYYCFCGSFCTFKVDSACCN